MTIHDPDLERTPQTACHPMFRGVPSSVEFNKLRKRLLRNTRQAIEDFAMVKARRALAGRRCPAARIPTGCWRCCSTCKWRGLLPVELLACNLDQGQPNFPKHILPDFLTRHRRRSTGSNTGTPIRS